MVILVQFWTEEFCRNNEYWTENNSQFFLAALKYFPIDICKLQNFCHKLEITLRLETDN